MPYIGGVGTYRQTCDEIAAKGYEGFKIDPMPQRSMQGRPDASAEPLESRAK
jgi:cyclohexanone monooxygenase